MIKYLKKTQGDFMKQILSLMRAAVDKYNMIDENDVIAVGVSGGKDSLVLLQIFHHQ